MRPETRGIVVMTESSEKPKKRGPGKPFLPGQSGNKGGRPKELDGLRELIREHGLPLAERMLRIALGTETRDQVTMGGDVVAVGPSLTESIKATEVLWSYGYGKPAQVLELHTPRTDDDDAIRTRLLELQRDPATAAALQTIAEATAVRQKGAPKAIEAPTPDAMPIAGAETGQGAAPEAHPIPRPAWLDGLLLGHSGIAISGWPGTGKTTLSGMIRDRMVMHTDDHMHLEWSAASQAVADAVNATVAPFVVEGVAVPRALRKGMLVEAVVWLRTPHRPQTPKQQSMGRGMQTVLDEWLAVTPHTKTEYPDAFIYVVQK